MSCPRGMERGMLEGALGQHSAAEIEAGSCLPDTWQSWQEGLAEVLPCEAGRAAAGKALPCRVTSVQEAGAG